MKLKKVCVLMLAGCLAFSGCGKNDTAESKTDNKAETVDVIEDSIEDDIENNKKDENATGSFDSMRITYTGKYSINFQTKASGHPSGGVDFETSYGWRNDEGSGGCIVSYYVYTDNRIEDDYDNYDSLDEYVIDGKAYKVLAEGEEVNLLYKVDDNFYVRVCLWNTSQFDASGSSTDITCTPLYMLQNGYLDDEIIMEIEADK